MDLPTALEFIGQRRNGILTTIRGDGRPQLSNIVYALGADGVIRISVTADRAKTRNLSRDPRATLYVGREDFGAYAVVDCDAEVLPTAATIDDPTVDALVELYRDVAGEHPDWDDYRRAMVTDARLVLLLRPTRAYGMLGR